jgi:uncharacterized membrane protein
MPKMDEGLTKLKKTISLYQQKVGLIITLVASSAYTFLFSYLSILKYKSYNAHSFDLAIMIQTIWNTSKGRFLEESINLSTPASRIWEAHKEFIFIPIAVLYRIFSHPELILFMQTFFLAVGAIAVYLLAVDKLENVYVACGFSLAYLLYPAIHNANLFDVHGITFATSMLLFTFYFIQRGNDLLFYIFALISLSCREDTSLILVMFSLYAIFFLKKKKLGIITSSFSIFWFFMHYTGFGLLRTALGLPEFVQTGDVPFHWDHLKAVTTSPFYIVTFLAKKYNIVYMIDLLGPVAFFSLLSPVMLLLATPTFAINFLSDYFPTHSIQYYYTSTITPIVFISAIYGTKNLLQFLEKKNIKNIAKFKQLFLGMTALAVIIFSMGFASVKSSVRNAGDWRVTDHHHVINKVIATIPESASLVTENSLTYHAANRRELYIFPDHINDADYILYDFMQPEIRLMTRSSFRLPSVPPVNEYIQRLLLDNKYGLVRYEDGVALFKRNAPYEEGLKKLTLAGNSDIYDAEEVKVSDEISLVGYAKNKDAGTWSYSEPEGLSTTTIKHVTLYWRLNQKTDVNLRFVYKLENEQARYLLENQPVWNLYPTSKWNEGDVVRDHLFWPLAKDMSSGNYKLFVSIQNEPDSSPFVQLFAIEIGD